MSMALVPASAGLSVERNLSEIADSIWEHYERGKQGYLRALDSYLAIGRDLKEARERFPDNQGFGEWFHGQSFPFSQRWAWTLREAAEHEPAVRVAFGTQVLNGDAPNIKTALAEAKGQKPEAARFTGYSSESGDWHTPPEVIERVVQTLGAIDLDPCAESAKAIPAAKHFTAAEDGLSKSWRGRVYMNPPYGDAIKDWVQKLAAELEAGRVPEAIALVPARTDTAWWRDSPHRFFCLWTGRLRFSGADSGAPFPSAVLYFGDRHAAFVEAFGGDGDMCVRLDGPIDP